MCSESLNIYIYIKFYLSFHLKKKTSVFYDYWSQTGPFFNLAPPFPPIEIGHAILQIKMLAAPSLIIQIQPPFSQIEYQPAYLPSHQI